jgi:secreted PhoX family phosphatase
MDRCLATRPRASAASDRGNAVIHRRALLAGAAAFPAAEALAQGAPGISQRLDDAPSAGIRRDLLIQWGDRVAYDAPAFAPVSPSLAAAEGQFGWDTRVVAALASPRVEDGIPRAVLAVGHPTLDPAMAFPDGRDRLEIAGAMQGASLINIQRRGGAWLVTEGGFQMRRLHARTLCRMGGAGGPARGVFGITGGSATPWGSLLLTEGEGAAWARRLPGVEATQAGHVVELDPFEPQSVPVKRTALGRLGARDVAAAQATDGRAVVFLADGREGGLLWRFVSDGPAQEPNALDQGTLYVARFEAGSLRWIALPADAEPYGAAVARGATSLGRPVALALDPNGARLCLALRESARNPAGAVVEMLFATRDPAADTAIVESLIEGRLPPRPRAGREPAVVPPWPVAPTSICLDGQGNLLLGTAQPARDSPLPDALYVLPLEGPARGQPSLAYITPLGAALGGVAVVPSAATWIAGVAHPGAGMGAQFAAPRSRWPHFRDGEPPRGGVVALSRGG